jgi:hypothetical protein
MRKIKTMNLGDQEVTVNELRVKDIRELLKRADEAGREDSDIFDEIARTMTMCTDLSEAEILDLAPSELKQLWEAIREVNSDFFELVSQTAALGSRTSTGSTSSSASS